MDRKLLMKGYKNVVETIYSSKYFYDRVLSFLKDYNFKKSAHFRITQLNIPNVWGYVLAFLKSVVRFGILEKSRLYYRRNFFYSIRKGLRAFSAAIRFPSTATIFEKYMPASKFFAITSYTLFE